MPAPPLLGPSRPRSALLDPNQYHSDLVAPLVWAAPPLPPRIPSRPCFWWCSSNAIVLQSLLGPTRPYSALLDPNRPHSNLVAALVWAGLFRPCNLIVLHRTAMPAPPLPGLGFGGPALLDPNRYQSNLVAPLVWARPLPHPPPPSQPLVLW